MRLYHTWITLAQVIAMPLLPPRVGVAYKYCAGDCHGLQL